YSVHPAKIRPRLRESLNSYSPWGRLYDEGSDIMKLQTKITLFSSIFVFILIALVNTVVYLMFLTISTDDELTQLSSQTNTIVETLQDNKDITDRNLLNAFLPSNEILIITN